MCVYVCANEERHWKRRKSVFVNFVFFFFFELKRFKQKKKSQKKKASLPPEMPPNAPRDTRLPGDKVPYHELEPIPRHLVHKIVAHVCLPQHKAHGVDQYHTPHQAGPVLHYPPDHDCAE